MNKIFTYCCLIVVMPLVLSHASITWVQKTNMPTGRDGLGIGVVDGLVYCIGGWTNGLPATATGVVEAYDPVADSWSTMNPMPTPRGFLAVCVLDNKIYALGGWSGSSTAHTTVEVFDPAGNGWTALAPMQTGRDGLGAEVVDGKIYAIGGFHSGGTIVEEYDTSTGSWSYKTPMSSTRFFFASEVIAQKVYVAAGRGAPGNYSETWEYNPAADTSGGVPWRARADIPTTRYHPEAGVIAGKMYVCGGLNGSDISCGELGQVTRAEVATVEVYDPVTDAWVTEDPMLFARRELDVGVVGDNLYAIGGWPVAMCRINEEGQVVTGIKQEDHREVNATHFCTTFITGPGDLPDAAEYRIFDITGRQVHPLMMKPGVYFIEIGGEIEQKVVKIK